MGILRQKSASFFITIGSRRLPSTYIMLVTLWNVIFVSREFKMYKVVAPFGFDRWEG